MWALEAKKASGISYSTVAKDSWGDQMPIVAYIKSFINSIDESDVPLKFN